MIILYPHPQNHNQIYLSTACLFRQSFLVTHHHNIRCSVYSDKPAPCSRKMNKYKVFASNYLSLNPEYILGLFKR
jgi:hypothetical protein